MAETPLAVHRHLCFCQLTDTWRLSELLADPLLGPKIVARFANGMIAVTREDEDFLVGRLRELGIALEINGRWRP